MKKILVLAESLRINETSSGIVSSTFIQLLCEAGFELSVITPKNFSYAISWLPQVDIQQFDMPEVDRSILDSIPKLRAIPTYWHGYNRRFSVLIKKWIEVIQIELTKNTYDFIYVLGSGSEFAPHFAMIEVATNIPWIANFHDPFPWHIYPEPYKKKRNWINYILERKTKKIIQKAWRVSFPSQLLMQHMATYFPEIIQKGFVVPHIGCTLQGLHIQNECLDIALDKTKINIVHVGTLLGPRNPEYLLKAIERLQDKEPWIKEEVHFIFIGPVARELKTWYAKKYEHITFVDARLSYSKSLEFIRDASALMIIEAIAEFSPFMPGKLADIAYWEKPILALTPEQSEVMRILGSNYPYHAELDKADQIEQAVLNIVTDIRSNTIKQLSIQNCRAYVSIEANIQVIKQHLLH